MKRIIFPLLFFVTVPASRTYGQADSTGQAAPSFLPETYYTNFNISLPIYNGRIFDNYPVEIKGQALIPEDHWAAVTVLYDGVWYKVTGRYDRYADQLVIRNPDSTSLFVPDRERVKRFLMEGRTFVSMEPGSGPFNGYYEQISDGIFAVFIKRSMILNEDISGPVVEKDFQPQHFYFIRKNGQYHQVRTKSNLYNLIGEKKSEILRAIRNEKIKFRKEPEAAIRIAAGFYK